MATIDSKRMVDEIIAANGQQYEDEEPVVKIVEYRNCFDGRTAYGLIFEGEPLDKYRETAFVMEPKTIWERKT